MFMEGPPGAITLLGATAPSSPTLAGVPELAKAERSARGPVAASSVVVFVLIFGCTPRVGGRAPFLGPALLGFACYGVVSHDQSININMHTSLGPVVVSWSNFAPTSSSPSSAVEGGGGGFWGAGL